MIVIHTSSQVIKSVIRHVFETRWAFSKEERLAWEGIYIPAGETTVHAEEGHAVSQQRNVYQRLEMHVENGAAGQAGSMVGNRASLVSGGKRDLSGDLQTVSSRTVCLCQ